VTARAIPWPEAAKDTAQAMPVKIWTRARGRRIWERSFPLISIVLTPLERQAAR
jgi:hypothetical protein